MILVRFLGVWDPGMISIASVFHLDEKLCSHRRLGFKCKFLIIVNCKFFAINGFANFTYVQSQTTTVGRKNLVIIHSY